MEEVKVRKSGEAYFLKLPSDMENIKNFVISPSEDNTLILAPKGSKFANILESLNMFSEDIFEDWEEDKI